ncbi:MAG: hypothetical protein BGO95_04035 [Micrococcales bacterium 73-13]|nr:MAG: hypothetical protein BGO95_04035 [Micrococcales bacterium 73-13]
MTLSLVLAAEEHAPQALALPIWAFPTIAALFFAVGAIIVFTYRDVANRHSHKHAAGAAHEDHDAHGGHGH